MPQRTIIYLTQPRITRSFAVEVVGEDATSAELMGMDILGVDMLLLLASGSPAFDLEFGGKLFRRCSLSTMHTQDSIPFTFESSRQIEV